jgi:hypothetical protein
MRFGHYADWAHYEESCSLVEKIWRARVARSPKAKRAEKSLAKFHTQSNVVNLAKLRIARERRRAAG